MIELLCVNMKKKLSFFIKYSIIFIAISSIIAFFYYTQGKSLINYGGDGFRQHFKALVYISSFYKEIVKNIFVNKQFLIPQWRFVIGEGSDILQTFHYYGLGDILNIFSVFVKEDKLYLFYDISIFIRMFLSGIVFSELCFYISNKDDNSILIGSLLYSFCSFALVSLGGHIYFINGLIYLPLVILGVEKIIKDNKPLLLPIAVMLSALSSIYFFYMIVISTVIYVIVRILFLKASISEKVKKIISITIFSFLGVLMSGIVFIPVFYSMIINSRLSTSITSALLYDISYYKNLASSFVFGDGYFGNYTVLGLLTIIALFNCKNKKVIKILLLICLVFVCLPFFGKLYNAMTYVTDRYLFIIDLVVCYAITDSIDDIIESKNKFVYLALLIIYFAVAIILNKEIWQIYVLLLGGSICFVLFINFVKNERLNKLVCLAVAVFSILLTIMYRYLPSYWNYAKNGTDIEIAGNVRSKENIAIDSIDDNSFYRYSGDSLETNACIQGNVSSTGYYWSVANSDVMNFRKEMGLSDHNNHHYDSYDDSTILNSLASVKYYLVKETTDKVPYGFEPLKEDNNHQIYKGNNSSSLIYGYDETIYIEDWEDYDIISKQELLTRYAVIDNKGDNVSYLFDNKDINYEMNNIDGLSIDESNINVNKSNASYSLTINSNIEGEYYLLINGFDTNTNTNIKVTNDNLNKLIMFKSNDSPGYANRHDFAINLGYYKGINDSISLIFPDICNIKYDSIRIVCLPLDNAISNIKELNSIKIEELDIETNDVKATINTDKDKILCFSIPYNKGWKLYVDGEKQDLQKCNVMYMGTKVSKGQHNIELKYSTPLLKEGAIISLVSCALYVFLLIKNKRNKGIN